MKKEMDAIADYWRDKYYRLLDEYEKKVLVDKDFIIMQVRDVVLDIQAKQKEQEGKK